MVLRLSGGRRLLSPPGDTARPTASRVRLAVMNCLAAELPGARWLDLCSGSGVMACEALQRGASSVVAIERDRRIATICRSNLLTVQQGLPVDRRNSTRVVVHCMPVERWLRASGESAFDLIYADPPYDAGLYESIAEGVLAAGLLKADGTLVFECGTNRKPALSSGWLCRDERHYGSTSLLLLQRAEPG
ncbi:MAG: 16S rRNA (guanine(966)-N(2))-methyltransferase RsmD [Cyanobacteriota bacterium]